MAEDKRKRGHKPVRKLVEAASNVLLAARPCWAMSPIVVSRLLPARRLFDIVIFDEASQVEPVDAMTSIMRGSQVVVAGDDKQLPPTDYFRSLAAGGRSRTRRDDTPAPPRSATSSRPTPRDLVPTCGYAGTTAAGTSGSSPFPTTNTYDNELTTVPGRDFEGPLQPHVVSGAARPGRGAGWPRSRGRWAQVAHAADRPDESLGVITTNIKHKERIDTALAGAVAEHPALDYFCARMNGPRRRLFVKNIDRVQGDERDVMILT